MVGWGVVGYCRFLTFHGRVGSRGLLVGYAYSVHYTAAMQRTAIFKQKMVQRVLHTE